MQWSAYRYQSDQSKTWNHFQLWIHIKSILKNVKKKLVTIFKVSAGSIAKPPHETREEKVPTDNSQWSPWEESSLKLAKLIMHNPCKHTKLYNQIESLNQNAT